MRCTRIQGTQKGCSRFYSCSLHFLHGFYTGSSDEIVCSGLTGQQAGSQRKAVAGTALIVGHAPQVSGAACNVQAADDRVVNAVADQRLAGYSVSDAARLLDCRNLRECGCSMKETAGILCAGDEAELAGALEDYCDRLAQRLEWEQKVEQHARARAHAIALVAAGRVEPSLCTRPGFYWCPLVMPGKGAAVRQAALPDPEEGYPIPFADSTLLLPESFPKGDRIAAQEVQVGYGVQRCYTAAFPAVQQTVLIPGGHCIHTILRINDDFSISTEQMEPVRKMAEREGLVFSGQPLTHRIVSLYRETETFRYDDAWFPVEKKA